ncbi:MAG: DUF6435 family protein [Planctomycetota bacterium]
MFGFFKNSSIRRLESAYQKLQREARDLQRKGDIQGCAAVTARAEEIARQLDALEK